MEVSVTEVFINSKLVLLYGFFLVKKKKISVGKSEVQSWSLVAKATKKIKVLWLQMSEILPAADRKGQDLITDNFKWPLASS